MTITEQLQKISAERNIPLNNNFIYSKLDLLDKNNYEAMGIPFFGIAYWFDISINTADIEYLNNIIKSDKNYKLIHNSYNISENYKDVTRLQRVYANINQIVFYEEFYNDIKCPHGIKLLLFCHIGLCRDYVNEFSPTILKTRYHTVKQWLQSVR